MTDEGSAAPGRRRRRRSSAATPPAPMADPVASEPLSARGRLTSPSPRSASRWLPVIDDRSPNAWVCPFLRAVDADDGSGVPVESPDAANRCAALREPVPQSLRQQELVCLTSGHVNCPRYLRGAVSATDAAEAAVVAGRSFRPPTLPVGRPSISPAILAALVMVVVAFAASVAFVVARGGLELTPSVGEGPSASAVAGIASPSPSTAATGAPSAAVASATVEPAATPAPTPTPTGADRHAGTDAESDARADPGAHARADARADRDGRADLGSLRAADAVRRRGHAAGSTRSGAATTCSASPTTSACRSTRSTTGTRGHGPRACGPAWSCASRHRPAESSAAGRPRRRAVGRATRSVLSRIGIRRPHRHSDGLDHGQRVHGRPDRPDPGASVGLAGTCQGSGVQLIGLRLARCHRRMPGSGPASDPGGASDPGSAPTPERDPNPRFGIDARRSAGQNASKWSKVVESGEVRPPRRHDRRQTDQGNPTGVHRRVPAHGGRQGTDRRPCEVPRPAGCRGGRLALDGRLPGDPHPSRAGTSSRPRSRPCPVTDEASRRFQRFVFAGAAEVELDRQGRILLPAFLRDCHRPRQRRRRRRLARSRRDLGAGDLGDYGQALDDPQELAQAFEGLGI